LTIELGAVDAGGAGPIWSRSGSASETLVVAAAASLVLIALALLLALVLPIEEEELMPSSSPAKPTPSTTPAEELPFPGKLIEGKYDVQYLHL
jgi:hypothetical protein